MVQDIGKILEKVDSLPQNFHIAVKVAKMLDDFNISINQLAEAISMDQSLTTKILKHCNSAQFGFTRKVSSVKDAISKIGFTSLKSMVFMLVSKGSFNQKIDGYDLEKGALWRNSLSCGVYSRYLAETMGYNDPELAFTAGLLRDIGKLLIHEHVRADYQKILEIINSEGVNFSEAEESVLGFNHSQIGAMAANKWKFPKILVDSIRYHHKPLKAIEEEAEDISLINIVHVADSISAMLGNGLGSDSMMYELDISCLEQLGFDASGSGIELLLADMVELSSEINLLVSSVD